MACHFNAISSSVAYFLYLFYNQSVCTLDYSVSVYTICVVLLHGLFSLLICTVVSCNVL